jgi:hypothetical protein
MLTLLVRDAAQRELPGDTTYSFGYWKTTPGDEFPSFHARLKVTLDEIREACNKEEK